MPDTADSGAAAPVPEPYSPRAVESRSRAHTLITAGAAAGIALAVMLGNRLFWLVPSDRVHLTGGASIRLRLMHALAIVAGMLAVALVPHAFAVVRRRRWWWVPFALLAVDLLAALVVGVRLWRIEIVAHFVLPAAAALGALCCGIAIGRLDRSIADRAVAGSLVISALAAAIQTLQRRGIESLPGEWLAIWDQRMREVFKSQFTMARAEGFDVNPNSFSFLGIVGLTWALFAMPRGAMRWVSIAAALAVIGLGQSRTALATTIVLAIVYLIDRLRSHVPPRVLTGEVIAGTLVALAVTMSVWGVVGTAGSRSIAQRYETGAATVSAGVDADANLSERARVWGIAAGVAMKQPLGTWSAPGRVLGGSPDNDLVSRMIMAGPISVLAMLVTLVWLWRALRPPGAPFFGPAFAITLGLSSLTAVATQALAFLLLGWLLVGCAMSLAAMSDLAGDAR